MYLRPCSNWNSLRRYRSKVVSRLAEKSVELEAWPTSTLSVTPRRVFTRHIAAFTGQSPRATSVKPRLASQRTRFSTQRIIDLLLSFGDDSWPYNPLLLPSPFPLHFRLPLVLIPVISPSSRGQSLTHCFRAFVGEIRRG